MSPDRSRRDTASLCALYLIAFMSAYTWSIFPRTLESMGWAGTSVGLLYSARKVVDIPSLFAWGSLADRYDRKRLLQAQLGVGLGASVLMALTLGRSDAAMVVSVLLYGATAASLFPVADSLTISHLGADRFGFVRAFGSAGYALMACGAAGIGWVTNDYAQFAAYALPLLILAMSGAFLTTFALPSKTGSAPQKQDEESAGADDDKRVRPLKALVDILRQPTLLAMLCIGALHWAAQTPLNLFLVALCEHRALPVWVPGAGVAIGVLCEMCVLAFSSALLARLRPSIWLLIAIITGALRWWLMSGATSIATMLALQTLHALSFGAFFMASVALLTRLVPERLRASGQSIFYLVVFGAGSILGNVLTGYVFDHRDVTATFELWALIEVLLLIPGAFFARRVITR